MTSEILWTLIILIFILSLPISLLALPTTIIWWDQTNMIHATLVQSVIRSDPRFYDVSGAVAARPGGEGYTWMSMSQCHSLLLR